ncbi:hypothetical protein GQ457_03G015010 [Hibiscus cannabinus]
MGIELLHQVDIDGFLVRLGCTRMCNKLFPLVHGDSSHHIRWKPSVLVPLKTKPFSTRVCLPLIDWCRVLASSSSKYLICSVEVVRPEVSDAFFHLAMAGSLRKREKVVL